MKIYGGAGDEFITYNVTEGNDYIYIIGGTGKDTLIVHPLNESFSLINETGEIIFFDGTGGSLIWFRSIEKIKVVYVDLILFQISYPNDITGGPDLSTRETGPGEAFLSVFEPATVTSSLNEPGVLPALFLLENYPNPFNESTKIKYSVPGPVLVQVIIFNVLGNEITLVNEEKPAGTYEVIWDAEKLPVGFISAG